MNYFINAAVLAAMVVGGGNAATAETKKANAPGQDRTCLVTTKTAGSFNDVDVVSAKWLPRKAAEKQASKDPSMMRVFNYQQDRLVTNKTYASAEELCNKHFNWFHPSNIWSSSQAINRFLPDKGPAADHAGGGFLRLEPILPTRIESRIRMLCKAHVHGQEITYPHSLSASVRSPKIDVNNQLAARRAIQTVPQSQRTAVITRLFHGGWGTTRVLVDGKEYDADALRYEQLQSGLSPDDLGLQAATDGPSEWTLVRG